MFKVLTLLITINNSPWDPGVYFVCFYFLNAPKIALVGNVPLNHKLQVPSIVIITSVISIKTHSLLFFSMYWVQKLTSLKKFVSSLKETNHLTSKTVRLLQEMDLIGKGFVL